MPPIVCGLLPLVLIFVALGFPAATAQTLPAADNVSAAAADRPNLKIIKIIDRIPQTIGGKLGGSFG